MLDLPDIDWSAGGVIYDRVVEHEGAWFRERLIRVVAGDRFHEKVDWEPVVAPSWADHYREARGVQA